MMHTRFHSRIRTALGALCAAALMATATGCSFHPQPEHPEASATTTQSGPITLVASLNQWGSLAGAIGGEDVKVTSILSSTTADAHDFEPTSKDVKTLHDADVVLVNGAGYDDWASKNLPSSVTCVSVSDIVGAMDGDNPHLWFSRDARFAIASELADTFARLRPDDKATFTKNLDAWKKREETLERRIHDFSETHPGMTYAATEDVAYYLMSDMGFEDRTPQGYAQASANESEPTAADLRDFKTLLSKDGVDLFIDNPQEATDQSKELTQDAKTADIPVESVTEQMPGDYKTLTAWIEALFAQITKAIDSSYVPSDDDDATTDGDGASPSDEGTATSTPSSSASSDGDGK